MKTVGISAEGVSADEIKKDLTKSEAELNQELFAMSKEGLISQYKSGLRLMAYMAEQIANTKKAEDWLPHIWQDPDFREFIESCDKVLTSKGHDYTQGDNTKGDALTFPGRLKNFYEAAKMMPGLSPFSVLGIYWWKHVTAVLTFLAKGQVESEPIEGRLVDCVNYCGFLLYKMIAFEKRRKAAGK